MLDLASHFALSEMSFEEKGDLSSAGEVVSSHQSLDVF